MDFIECFTMKRTLSDIVIVSYQYFFAKSPIARVIAEKSTAKLSSRDITREVTKKIIIIQRALSRAQAFFCESRCPYEDDQLSFPRTFYERTSFSLWLAYNVDIRSGFLIPARPQWPQEIHGFLVNAAVTCQ